MSHFACIGLAADTAEQFDDIVTRCCAAASPHPDHLEWRDASGASLVVHLEDNEITCVTPFFAAKELTRWRVTTRGAQIDPCVHCSGAACDVLDASGAMLTRAFIQWRRFVDSRQLLKTERTYELAVVAFAHALTICAAPEDFEAWQAEYWRGEDGQPRRDRDGEPLRFAEQFFMPEGMFAEPMEAVAMLSGRVRSAQWHTNELTGARFGHTRLSTYAGHLDVVFAPQSVPHLPEEGHLVVARVWLVGEPYEVPALF